MPDTTRLTADCDPAVVRDAVVDGLRATGFEVTWSDEARGTAERGAKGKSLAFGALSKDTYMRLSLAIEGGAGDTTLTLTPSTSGASAGLIGVRRSKKAFAEAGDAVRAALVARDAQVR